MTDPQHLSRFRSVLPHEPCPVEEFGFLHLQGAYEPKKKDPEAPLYWHSKLELEEAIRERLIDQFQTLGLPFPAQDVEAVDQPPFSKVRMTYATPSQAIAVQFAMRQQKISASQLFGDRRLEGASFSSGAFQVTVVTKQPLPDSSCCWDRSNPPKFRRLLHNYSDEQERQRTRFIFVSGLLVDPSPDSTTSSFWSKPYAAQDAIRGIFNRFDTSGLGVEVFLPRKQLTWAQTCHVGMRSAQNCQEALAALQGTSLVWKYQHDEQISSGTLFLDYALVSEKSMAKLGDDRERGQPSRPECTSSTDHITIPGLVIVQDYVTEDQEEVLMAALTGPDAPWAPSQTNMSQTGAVKRLVQHYGYVFDYKTADVLRNRDEPGADCPPMPQLEDDNDDASMVRRVDEGQGWKVLADVIGQTRKYPFRIPSDCDQKNEIEIPRDCDQKNEIERVSYPYLNQLTVNHYKPGQGIGSHVDTPSAFGDGLISLSLNGGIVMEFRKSGTEPPLKKLVYLPPRSLVLMSGPARYDWEHYIVTRRTDTHQGKVLTRKLRVSLTLRTALTVDGHPLPLVESRDYPPKWGSDLRIKPSKGLATPATERDHVHAVYDAIATQWHHTRGKRGVLWPGATQFLQRLPPGSIVADCGCGDGKYFPAIFEAGNYVIGTDISRPLLETAFLKDNDAPSSIPDLRKVSPHREYLRDRPAVAVADCMSIPLRDRSCDAAICIAVMHHLSTKERRIRCVEELARVVRVGGMINIQAWAMEQDEGSRRRFAGADVFVPFNAQPKYLDKVAADKEGTRSASSTENGHKSVAEMFSEAYDKADFDEQKGLVVFQRYCHLYRKGEMEQIIDSVKGVKLLENGYESGNYFVILEVVES
jgi:alkylated DNA repair dioxygenase AlkB/ubiquinone/menaquinone biosynthesis C-methylase UbiE